MPDRFVSESSYPTEVLDVRRGHTSAVVLGLTMSVPKGPFSQGEIDGFVHDGYVRLKDAFSRDVARACREELWRLLKAKRGVEVENPETWTEERIGLTNIFKPEDGTPWTNVFTDRVKAGISQLVGGDEKWDHNALGCGWWVISFPGILQPPWEACGNWHIDGSHFRHYVYSHEQVLLPIFLFNDVNPQHGGTALAVGSHLRTAALLYQHPNGMSGGALSRSVRALPGILDNVVEATGKAGDLVCLHPFLLHARSKNLGPKVAASIRVACFPCVAGVESLSVDDKDSSEENLSPVEQSIVQARDRASVPLAFGKRGPGSFVGRKRRRLAK